MNNDFGISNINRSGNRDAKTILNFRFRSQIIIEINSRLWFTEIEIPDIVHNTKNRSERGKNSRNSVKSRNLSYEFFYLPPDLRRISGAWEWRRDRFNVYILLGFHAFYAIFFSKIIRLFYLFFFNFYSFYVICLRDNSVCGRFVVA